MQDDTHAQVTPSKTYEFQAESKDVMTSVIEAIQNNILWALNQMDSGTKKVDGLVLKPEEVLAELHSNPANRTCAECGAVNPDWASLNLGIMFCTNCSGCHRSLGVHISQVRSATLDEWSRIQMELVIKLGNDRSNAIWEARMQAAGACKPGPQVDMAIREKFIQAKYKMKAFLDRGEVEDPGKELFENIKTDRLDRTVLLIALGASKDLVHPVSGRTPGYIAHVAGQRAQVELLKLNDYVMSAKEKALVENGSDPTAAESMQGWLKLGSTVPDPFARRWCVTLLRAADRGVRYQMVQMQLPKLAH